MREIASDSGTNGFEIGKLVIGDENLDLRSGGRSDSFNDQFAIANPRRQVETA